MWPFSKIRERKEKEEWIKLYNASSNEIENEAKRQGIELLAHNLQTLFNEVPLFDNDIIAKLTNINQRGAPHSIKFFVDKPSPVLNLFFNALDNIANTYPKENLSYEELKQKFRKGRIPSNYGYIGCTPSPANKEYCEKEVRIKDIDREIGAIKSAYGNQRAQEEYAIDLRAWESIPLSEWEKRNTFLEWKNGRLEENNGRCWACFGRGATLEYYDPSPYVYPRGLETPQIQVPRTCAVCKGAGKIDANTLRLSKKPRFFGGYKDEWDTDEMKELKREKSRLYNEKRKLIRFYSVYAKIVEL